MSAEKLSGIYRRRPVLAWGGTAIGAGVAAAVVVIVLVGGASEPADVHLECSVSNSDGSLALSVTGMVTKKEAKSGCNGLAAGLSGQGAYWRVGLPQPTSSYPEIMCGLNAPSGKRGTVIVEVDPERSTYEATALCGKLAHKGWTQFTQGGVMGPWQHEASLAAEAEEEAEEAEAAIAEAEQLEVEEEQVEVEACEEGAKATEEAEIARIQKMVKAKVAAASSEERGWEIEEEGWAAEEGVWARTEEADARCVETGGAESGVDEYR